jgi:hypothetical protein
LLLLLRFHPLLLPLLLLQSTGGFFTPPKEDDLSLWMTGVFVLVSHVLLTPLFFQCTHTHCKKKKRSGVNRDRKKIECAISRKP